MGSGFRVRAGIRVRVRVRVTVSVTVRVQVRATGRLNEGASARGPTKAAQYDVRDSCRPLQGRASDEGFRVR